MATATLTQWSGIAPGDARIGRRGLLVLSAAAVAALLVDAVPPLPAIYGAREILATIGKSRWDWHVELAVLQRLVTERQAALDLLWAALEIDLDPKNRWRSKRAVRLYDLYAAATGSTGRAALADLVTARSTDPALRTRAQRWRSAPPRVSARLWRTVGPDGRPLGIVLSPA